MSPELPKNLATYRLRILSRKGDLPNNYRGTYEILDEQTQQVMAYCDVSGHATFSVVSIMDKDHNAWTMKPNRKILPTRWIMIGPSQSLAIQFDQNLSRKLKNPIYRVVLTLLDGKDKEIYHVVDPREQFIDRVLGVGPDDWVLMEGDEPVARITNLVRYEGEPAGLWQKLKAFLTPTDKGVVSLKGSHVLSAPIALAMLLILHELTASSSCDK
jgi:hypothetical protein